MTPKIGFLGLGTMGAPMAINLLNAGYALNVWNRSAEAAQPLAEQGATVTSTPAQAAQDADILISMLADDHAVEDVMLTQGALKALKPGALHINMATISIALAEQLTAQHQTAQVGYIAAPVLGRVDVATAGQLNILTAGEPQHLAQAQPLFDILGQTTWHFGDTPAQANAVKLGANFMIASAINTMGEASALTQGYGIDKKAFIDLITSTLFATPVYKGYGQAIAEDRFEPPGFKLALGHKDVRLALEAAEQARVPMPQASLLKDNGLDALAHGDGTLDWAALATVAYRRAGQR